MSEWQPIETAPKDGTEIILWPCSTEVSNDIDPPPYRRTEPAVRVGRWIEATPRVPSHWSFYGASEEMGEFAFNPLVDATHWMPLPEPPHPIEGAQ